MDWMELSFEKRADGLKHLPWNYIPTALPALMGVQMQGFFPLLPVPHYSSEGILRNVVQIAGSHLANPVQVAERMDGLGESFIGPPSANNVGFETREISEEGQVMREGYITVLALIDTGIAFWNTAFRVRGLASNPTRFKSIGILRFDEDQAGRPGLVFRPQEDVSALVDQTQSDGHDGRVIDRLGEDFPASVFGPGAERLYREDGFNHGTATADLLMRADPDGSGPVFGVELPRDILLDANGAALQGVLAFALRELIAEVVKWQIDNHPERNLDLRIAVPFAFTGSPLGGTHPVLRDIAISAGRLDLGTSKLTICFPTGNHLQDRLHAEFGSLSPGPQEESIRWYLQPDDYGSNTMEISWQGADRIGLGLGKDGTGADVVLHVGDVHVLKSNGAVIGAVKLLDAGSGWRRMCLSLGQTARRDLSVPVVPCGEWTLRLRAVDEIAKEVTANILREDGTRIDTRHPPSRQSRFNDGNYVEFDSTGGYLKSDPASHCLIRRKGTMSLLAAGAGQNIRACGARERIGASFEPAWYSGLPATNSPAKLTLVDIDLERPSSGLLVLVNGSARRMAYSGTSAAAAIAAGQ